MDKIDLLMHQNLYVKNIGTDDKPDYTVGGTENLKQELVKLFAIPVVVQQSEQLKGFADYAQKRMWEDDDKDLSEFVDEFLRL